MPRWPLDPYQFASLPTELLSPGPMSEPQSVAPMSLPVAEPEEATPPESAPESDPESTFDPSAHTVAEVMSYAHGLSDFEIDDLIATERVGRNRSTLISQLEAML